MDYDVMDILREIRPLPRGERIALYILTVPKEDPTEVHKKWDALLHRSEVLSQLFDVWWLTCDDQEWASNWRKYAYPVTQARSRRVRS